MAMKEYSTFLKAPGLKPQHQIVSSWTLGGVRWDGMGWGGSYHSAEMQLMYSTASANWAFVVSID